MSHATHANAALTPRARLRLARPSSTRAGRYRAPPSDTTCSWRTAKKWADRYRCEVDRPACVDRSSRPHRQPGRTPAPVVRKIVHLRWRQRLGPIEIGDRLRMPASTVHAVLVRCRLNRLTHVDRATGKPIRRYEHERPGDLLHVDVKKLGRVPDGGGRRYVGRVQGWEEPLGDRRSDRRAQEQAPQAATRHLLPAHRDRRPLPGGLRRGPRRRDQETAVEGAPQRRRLVRRPRRDGPARADRQRRLLPIVSCGATPAPSSASHRGAHTLPAADQRQNREGSTAP